MEIINMLCPACRKMFSNERVKLSAIGAYGDGYEHHNPPSLLKEASEAGCYICSKLWRNLTEPEKSLVLSTHRWTTWLSRGWIPWYNPHVGIYSWVSSETYPEIEFRFGSGSHGWKKVSFGVYGPSAIVNFQTYGWHSMRDVSIREYSKSVDLAILTASDQTWKTVRGWWDAAMMRYEADVIRAGFESLVEWERYRFKRVQFPSRLLDLESVGLCPDLCLSIDGTYARCCQYMTLTYRWKTDSDRPPSWHWSWELTRQSLERMRARISFEDLPQAFQDAITVTRKLQIRYLWIDAMCIIQDEEADKDFEISRMGHIYERAICNIAAGVGNVDTSLFAMRNVRDIQPLEVNIDWTELPFEPEEPFEFQGSRYLIEDDYLKHHTSHSLLRNRGWIVQEHILSNRILYFAPEQVFWYEQGYDACEVFPMGYVQPRDKTFAHIRPQIQPGDDIISGQPNDRETWNQIIRHYSATSLTNPGDKMKAVQGLAQHWQISMPEDRYCAGLWKSTFPCCLLWKLADGRNCDAKLSQRRAEFHAPSWSWLSVDGKVEGAPVDPYLGSALLQTEILAIDLLPKTPGNDFGALEKGTCTVRGPLKSAQGMYWPMTSLHHSIETPDWSKIEARMSPFGTSQTFKCSIDDMTCFLEMWNNDVPSQGEFNNKPRWLMYYLALPFICILGFVMIMAPYVDMQHWIGVLLIGSTCFLERWNNFVPSRFYYFAMPFLWILGLIVIMAPHVNILRWIGHLLLWNAYPLSFSIWHFTNIGSGDIYFLEIFIWNHETKGLVLQKQNDGTFRRLGTFSQRSTDFFKNASKQCVTLV